MTKTFSIMSPMAVALVCAMTVACSEEDSASTDASPSPDAEISAPLTTCGGILMCLQGCATSSCIADCVATGTAAAQDKYGVFQSCSLAPCLVAGDDGQVECTSETDSSAACIACVMEVGQSTACASELTDCLADE